MRLFNHIKHKAGTAVLALAFAVVSVATPWLGLAGTAYAVAPTTPVNVRLMTGGNSVAVLWEPAATGDPATSYKVYRGGVLKATVSPANNNQAQGNTQRWLDTTAVNATSYSYQVSAVNADGESALTTAKSITHSTTVVVPTVTIDPSTPATLTTFANNAKALIQAWYPKFVTTLGSPAGTDTTLTIKPVSGLANNAQHSGSGLIEYKQEWALANLSNPAALNLFLHESTHAAQLSGTGTQYLPWAHEGMAEYMQNYVFGDNNNRTITLTDTSHTWLRGYEYSAYMLNYVAKTFNKPNLVKDFDASFNPGYDLAFFRTQTNGLSVGDIWKQLGGRRVTSAMYLKNAGASLQCLDLVGQMFNPPAFAPPKLAACDFGNTAQQWAYIPDDATGTGDNTAVQQGELRVLTLPQSGTCLDVTGSGTTAGTTVNTYTCNGSVAQKWVINGNGSLRNPNSNMCLQPIAAGTAAGTAMEIATCSGATIQNWSIRPMGALFSPYSVACGSASVLSPVQTFACSGIPTQQFSYVQATPGAVSGQIKNPKINGCLRPVGGSTAVDAQMEFVQCGPPTNQQWQWQSDMKLKNMDSGLCLTLPAVPIPPAVVRQFFQTSCSVEASPASLKKFEYFFNY